MDDSSGDQFIVREAGAFWKELGMRTKVNAAVAAVRAEVAAGRLQWTESDVQRLIKPYPRRTNVDKILEAIGDDAGNDRHDGSSDDNADDMPSDQSGDSETSVGSDQEKEGEPNDENKIHDEDEEKGLRSCGGCSIA